MNSESFIFDFYRKVNLLSSIFFTAKLLKMDYHAVMKPDDEVDDIIVFIANYLNNIKSSKFGGLKEFAKSADLIQKNLSDFSNKYGKGSDPHFRTVYKALRAILNRPPIILEPIILDDLTISKIKHIREGDWPNILDVVINILYNADFADQTALDIVKSSLDVLWRQIIAKKEQEQVETGEKLSNSSVD